MKRRDFEDLVEEAVLALPDDIRGRLRNLAFVIEERAGEGERKAAEGSWGSRDLLGLYVGVPLTERHLEMSGVLPDKIVLYKAAIEEEAGHPENVRIVVRETVWHEIAHYFGFDEAGAERLERKWRRRGIKAYRR
jgi:predicted Zn-dependent protease with MMP-like domain